MLYRYCLLIVFVLFTVNIYAQTVGEELDELENNTFDLANNIVETTLDDVSININRNINRNWEVGSTISDISGDLSGVLNTGITTAGSVINTGITTTGEVINTTIVTLPDVLNTIMDLLVSSQEQLHELERRIGEDIDYLFDTSILNIAREAIATRFGTLAFGGIRSSGQALVGDVSNNNLTDEDVIAMYNMDSNKDGEISIQEMRQSVRNDRKNLPIIQRVFNILTRSDMMQAMQDRRDYNNGNINNNNHVYNPTEDGYFSNRTDSNTGGSIAGDNDSPNIADNININNANNSSISSETNNTNESITENINNNSDVDSNSNNLRIGGIVGGTDYGAIDINNDIISEEIGNRTVIEIDETEDSSNENTFSRRIVTDPCMDYENITNLIPPDFIQETKNCNTYLDNMFGLEKLAYAIEKGISNFYVESTEQEEMEMLKNIENTILIYQRLFEMCVGAFPEDGDYYYQIVNTGEMNTGGSWYRSQIICSIPYLKEDLSNNDLDRVRAGLRDIRCNEGLPYLDRKAEDCAGGFYYDSHFWEITKFPISQAETQLNQLIPYVNYLLSEIEVYYPSPNGNYFEVDYPVKLRNNFYKNSNLITLNTVEITNIFDFLIK